MKKSPFDVLKELSILNEPLIPEFFQQYNRLGIEQSSLLLAVLAGSSAVCGKIGVRNPVSMSTMPINLMVHILGEPGMKQNFKMLKVF